MILAPLFLAVAPAAVPPGEPLRVRLDRVADLCHLPRTALKVDPEGRLHVQPPPSAGLREFDCAFAQLKKAGVDTPRAIVGREVVRPPVKR